MEKLLGEVKNRLLTRKVAKSRHLRVLHLRQLLQVFPHALRESQGGNVDNHSTLLLKSFPIRERSLLNKKIGVGGEGGRRKGELPLRARGSSPARAVASPRAVSLPSSVSCEGSIGWRSRPLPTSAGGTGGSAAARENRANALGS